MVPMPYGSVWGFSANRYLEPLHWCVRLIWVRILCRWQVPCELQFTPSLHSSPSAGKQCWILNACAFPVYYWISKGEKSQENEVLIVLLCVISIFFSLLGHCSLRISPKLSLQVSIRGNWQDQGDWKCLSLSFYLQSINIQQPQKWGKNSLKPHSAKYQTLVFLSVRALPSYLSVLYRTVWITTFMTHCPLLHSFLRLQ